METKALNDSDRKKGRTFGSIVIEPFKQMKFGLYVIAISITFVILAATLFVMAFNEQYQHVMEIFSVVDPDVRWDLVTNDVFYQNAKRLGLLLFGFIAILMVVVFKLTHQYYGPLVSIERFVDGIINGEYNKRVTIRNTDELQRLAGKLNNMAENLEKRHGAKVDQWGQKVERRNRTEDKENTSEIDNAS